MGYLPYSNGHTHKTCTIIANNPCAEGVHVICRTETGATLDSFISWAILGPIMSQVASHE